MADKRVAELVRTINTWDGWRLVERTSGYTAYPPDPTQQGIVFHKTPSDHRWYANTVARLRRAGAPI